MGIGVLATAAALAGNPFSLGVAAGEVTPNGAFLWGHATPVRVELEVARDTGFRRLVLRSPARADPARNGTIHIHVGHLLPRPRLLLPVPAWEIVEHGRPLHDGAATRACIDGSIRGVG